MPKYQGMPSPFDDTFEFDTIEMSPFVDVVAFDEVSISDNQISDVTRKPPILKKPNASNIKNNNSNKISFENISEDDPHTNELSFDDTNSFDAKSNNKIERPLIESPIHNKEYDTLERHGTANLIVRRSRLGNQRNKNGLPKLGRAKTLKWGKQTLHNSFEDFNKNIFNDLSLQNRSSEFRNIYHNMALPDDMLDDDDISKNDYPRKKIRTTKYTPIPFFSKKYLVSIQEVCKHSFLSTSDFRCFPKIWCY